MTASDRERSWEWSRLKFQASYIRHGRGGQKFCALCINNAEIRISGSLLTRTRPVILSISVRMKYVLVSGGVISGIGKGVIASSTGLLLKTLGLRVTAIKIDPYMNIDAGTMSPLEHGEVFVLDDGGEVDLDLGNYERYLSVTLTRENNITTGKIYSQVIEREVLQTRSLPSG